MKLQSSLDPKDRRMLFAVLGLVAILFLILAFISPAEDASNPIPSSYLATQHGAKAAFTLLQQSGYSVQRWDQSLSDLAAQAGPGTVLILAEPNSIDSPSRSAIAAILAKGGRIVATGFPAGLMLPGSDVTFSTQPTFAACEAQPEGLQPLAGRGPIWITPDATWKPSRPEVQTAYTCAGQPVVVEYPVGKGSIIWWASSTPLENSSITRGQNMELLLNSIGPPQGAQVYWDESLHGPRHSQWDYIHGPVWPLLSLGALGLVLLVIFSMSRRSGPIRALPQAPRTTPIEFLEALGALYRSTGAASTVVEIAWERFRSQSALLTGQKTTQLDARELAHVLERRFGSAATGMEADLIAAEEARWDDKLKPRSALALIQTLRRHEETLRAAASRTQLAAKPAVPASAGVTLGT